ncbi:DUF1772 domain-containing protein [Brevibacterium paucivorans]|uniref:anthrone oxygenase family protein n=1 Tax=Brevibacterium paucivorans TaxID=170994 RepID=UPI00321BE294
MTLIVILLATCVTAVLAGFWCTWGIVVLPALDKVPPAVAVTSMRSLNESVLTPAFLIPFFASPVICLVGTIVCAVERAPFAAVLLGLAAGLQLLGVIVVTRTMNVPLNEELARTQRPPQEAWGAFSQAWQRAHVVRTIASCIALACCAGALWVY